jgi:aminopeptidase N
VGVKTLFVGRVTDGSLALSLTGSIKDTFTTMSGKEVALAVYSEHANVGQLDHAMTSLKRSMTWDEEAYGREYDLGIFNIVAVEDFNMGVGEPSCINCKRVTPAFSRVAR